MNRSINLTLVLGVALGVAITVGAVFGSTAAPWIFLNLVGFAIVFGGMVAASLIMYRYKDLQSVFKTVSQCIFPPEISLLGAAQQVIQLAELQQKDSLFFDQNLEWVRFHSLRIGLDMVRSGLRNEEIFRRRELLAIAREERAIAHAGFLLSLAKLAPGFGLLGTLVGLVVLLREMGSDGNLDQVGPALAISLLATLYGVILSNLFLQPLAENIRNSTEHVRVLERLITDGVLLLKEKRHPIHIREVLKSHLSWEDQVQFDESFKGTRGRPAPGLESDGGVAA